MDVSNTIILKHESMIVLPYVGGFAILIGFHGTFAANLVLTIMSLKLLTSAATLPEITR